MSGKIYEKVLKGLSLTRDMVFTSNSVLCRPPDNRDPEPFEIVRCGKYLDAQIKIVCPEIIVTFGAHAGRVMLGEDLVTISKNHGKILKSKKYNIDVFPLYHPAYIGAYSPIAKRQEFKNDIKYLKKILIERNIINE
jgi:DNA polymerase